MGQSKETRGSTPTRLNDYEYLRFMTRSRVAWEYLRRNVDYQRDWSACAPRQPKPIQMIDGTTLIRARRRFPRAEAWGLYTFRRS